MLTLLMVVVSLCSEVEVNRIRTPSCGGMTSTQACPLYYSPLCGSDGVTYANECFLCVRRLVAGISSTLYEVRFVRRETNTDIMVVKETACSAGRS